LTQKKKQPLCVK